MNHTVALLDLRVRRRPIIGYAVGLGAYAFAIVALYPSFKNDTSLDQLAQSSSTLMAAFGVNGSLTSPAGWLNANLFNNFVPLILIVLTVGYGSCLAGQDENGTLWLTATFPSPGGGWSWRSRDAGRAGRRDVIITALCALAGRGFGLRWRARPDRVTVVVVLLAIDFGAFALPVGAAPAAAGPHWASRPGSPRRPT